jgi:uncharacterized protein (DUF1697 family)
MSDKSVALIRGINVSGKNKLPMADLRNALEASGLDQVQTYIQSGNVVAEGPPPQELADVVRSTIRASFGYEVDVIGRTHAELVQTLEQNPFLTRSPAPDESKLGYLFFAAPPDEASVSGFPVDTFAPDEIALTPALACIRVHEGFGRTKLTTSFIEGKLGVRATMRNHRTLLKLIEMSA